MKRFDILALSLSLLHACSGEAHTQRGSASSPSSAQTTLNGLAAPEIGLRTITTSSMSRPTNGDIVFSYGVQDRRAVSEPELHLVSLSGRAIDTVNSHHVGKVVYQNGASATLTGPIPGDLLTATDGSAVRSLTNNYRACFRGPARSYFEFKTPRGGDVAARKALFYVPLHSLSFAGGGAAEWRGEKDASCPNEGPLSLRENVISLAGVLLDLGDGTFLVAADRPDGLVVRLKLDSSLEPVTRNERVYPLEYKRDHFLVPILLGKSYGLIADKSATVTNGQYQSMLDDLYAYLTKVKG